jgi:hypothetical protein
MEELTSANKAPKDVVVTAVVGIEELPNVMAGAIVVVGTATDMAALALAPSSPEQSSTVMMESWGHACMPYASSVE